MVQHIIYEHRRDYVFRKTIIWGIPILLVIFSLSYLSQGHFDWLGMLLIGVVWLGLLIYLNFFRKKK